MAGKKITCIKCVYFYTTWDRKFPYGCRAMGIKSGRPPAEAVRRASHQDCLAFQAKGPAEKSF